MCLAEVSKLLAIPERLPAQAGQLIKIWPDQLRVEVKIGMSAMPVQNTSNVRTTLRYGKMSVEISAGMEIVRAAEPIKVISQLC